MEGKRVIIINGTGGCGKDTFIEYVKDFSGLKVINVDSVAMVKGAALALGWDGIKDDKGRLLLSEIKKLWVKHLDGSFENISFKIDEFYKQNTYRIMFIHVREIDEIKRIKEKYNCLAIRIDRGTEIKTNSSDAQVNDYKYNYVVDNKGTLNDLKLQAKAFLTVL